jgi:hypothetical protein
MDAALIILQVSLLFLKPIFIVWFAGKWAIQKTFSPGPEVLTWEDVGVQIDGFSSFCDDIEMDLETELPVQKDSEFEDSV